MIGRVDRRLVLKAAAAGAAAAALPTRLRAQAARPRVVIVGGGFGGASCARTLRKTNPRIAVTLVESNPVYSSPPLSNAVVAGLYDVEHQQFRYDRLTSEGVAVLATTAISFDPAKHSVELADGSTLDYERLVLSPGIDFRWDAIPGYNRAAADIIPHAWTGGAQVALLRRQLESMEDGGTVVITSPVNPARCPPAPYERASLIAHYLKTKKPRSKVVILDAKDSFPMQKLFEAAWKELYPGLIEWVSLSDGGALTSVDVSTKTLTTDFEKYEAAVANVIPPQKAGHAAELAGVADRTGWCPVDPVTFVSKLRPDIHVIGDATIAGAIPRSASAAQSQGAICAAAIVSLLADDAPAVPTLSSSCFSMIAPDYAISQRGRYRPVEGQYVESDGGAIVSPLNAPRATRATEAREAEDWFGTITGETLG